MQTYFNIISIIVLVKEMPINNFILGCALLISRIVKETRRIYRLFMSFYYNYVYLQTFYNDIVHLPLEKILDSGYWDIY